MSRETMLRTAETLVRYCREGQEATGLEELYRPDCVSVEAMAGPDGSPEARGIEAIRAKHAWWADSFEMHGGSVEGPFPHGEDRFAVIFAMDATERASGRRAAMKEVGLYTVDADGRVIREEFFYGT
jgi:hypothetical protein